MSLRLLLLMCSVDKRPSLRSKDRRGHMSLRLLLLMCSVDKRPSHGHKFDTCHISMLCVCVCVCVCSEGNYTQHIYVKIYIQYIHIHKYFPSSSHWYKQHPGQLHRIGEHRIRSMGRRGCPRGPMCVCVCVCVYIALQEFVTRFDELFHEYNSPNYREYLEKVLPIQGVQLVEPNDVNESTWRKYSLYREHGCLSIGLF